LIFPSPLQFHAHKKDFTDKNGVNRNLKVIEQQGGETNYLMKKSQKNKSCKAQMLKPPNFTLSAWEGK